MTREVTQAERDILADAYAKGFMICPEIVRALYPKGSRIGQ